MSFPYRHQTALERADPADQTAALVSHPECPLCSERRRSLSEHRAHRWAARWAARFPDDDRREWAYTVAFAWAMRRIER